MNSALDVLLAFSLTYAVHSTVLIATVAIIVRVFAPRSNPLREALWTIALFGGVLTAAVQVAGLDSASATWTFCADASSPSRHATRLEPKSPGVEPTTNLGLVPAPTNRVPPKPRVELPRFDGSDVPPRFRREAIVPEYGARSVRQDQEVAIAREPSVAASDDRLDALGAALERAWTGVVAAIRATAERVRGPIGGLVALGAFLGFAYLLLLVLRSKRALVARKPVIDGPLFSRLAALQRRLGIRETIALSTSDAIATPVAFGLRRFEICVPRRSVELDVDQQDAMLAHEIAHLVRRDPLRLLLARAIECVAFFQPLNRLARRRLFEVVEMRCDAFAVERLGDGLALAGCLAEVASWLHDRRVDSLAPAMAETRSSLTTRIETLLDVDAVITREHRRSWLAPIAFSLLPGVALVAPGVAIGAPIELVGERSSPTSGIRTISDPDDVVIDVAEARALDDALAEVLATLDSETDSLNEEIADLKSMLVALGREDFADSLATLQDRLERLDRKRRAVESAWRRMRVAADDADDAPARTALPESRRKP